MERTCGYSFLMKNGEEYECEKCLLRSFKVWFRLVKWQIRCGVVTLDNGDRWIYYYGRFKWRWEKLK